MATTRARSAARDRTFRCGECGWTAPKWVGRCGECQAWGTVEEVGAPSPRSLVAGPVSSPARPIADVTSATAESRPTGIAELDRVLGGGLVPGAVVLVAGEPGVGKSTLLLAVAARVARAGRRALYVSGEESAAQVRSRAERIDAVSDALFVASESDLPAVLGQVEALEPDLLVLDSVQTVVHPDVDGTPGGVSQVRAVAAALIRVAKDRGLTTILVGHVTKDGSVAGPRTLEHLVDVVLHFEGEPHVGLRLVRAVKNRYGATDEVGCFELREDGLAELPDPTGLFVTRRDTPVPGTCVTVALEGRRPLLTEVQSLVLDAPNGSPRRSVSGLDATRVAMVQAVLDRHGGVPLQRFETYAATVGGTRLTEPAADLAIALALASGALNVALPVGLVAVGEVGLAGDLRRVPGVPRRIAEAARHGFTYAIAPVGCGPYPDGVTVAEAPTLAAALDLVARLGQHVGSRPLRLVRG